MANRRSQRARRPREDLARWPAPVRHGPPGRPGLRAERADGTHRGVLPGRRLPARARVLARRPAALQRQPRRPARALRSGPRPAPAHGGRRAHARGRCARYELRRRRAPVRDHAGRPDRRAAAFLSQRVREARPADRAAADGRSCRSAPRRRGSRRPTTPTRRPITGSRCRPTAATCATWRTISDYVALVPLPAAGRTRSSRSGWRPARRSPAATGATASRSRAGRRRSTARASRDGDSVSVISYARRREVQRLRTGRHPQDLAEASVPVAVLLERRSLAAKP